MNTIIFLLLSIIISLVVYLTALKVLSCIKRESVLFQVERQLVTSTLFVGVLGTYVGFYLGTVEGLTPESAALAMATAIPTSVAGITSYLVSTLLITIRDKASYE